MRSFLFLTLFVVFSISLSVFSFYLLHPVYVDVCAAYHHGACQKYQPNNILYIAFSNVMSVLTSAAFWTAIATFAIAGFTFTLKRSTDSLRIATTNIATAQTEETRILQRAYISVDPLGVTKFVSGDHAAALVGFRNVGNLPAKNVSWIVCRVFSKKFRPSPRIFRVNEKHMDPAVNIAPGSQARKGSRPITIRRFKGFQQGGGVSNRYLFVWGLVRYDDGFGKQRFNRFCHRYNLSAESNLTIHKNQGRYQERANEAD